MSGRHVPRRPAGRRAPLRVAALAALPLATAACGGASSFSDPAELAEAVGCEDFQPLAAVTGAEAGGSCTVLTDPGNPPTEQVRLLTFADDGQRDDYIAPAVQDGAVFAYGDGWAAEVESANALEQILSAVEGSTASGETVP